MSKPTDHLAEAENFEFKAAAALDRFESYDYEDPRCAPNVGEAQALGEMLPGAGRGV